MSSLVYLHFIGFQILAVNTTLRKHGVQQLLKLMSIKGQGHYFIKRHIIVYSSVCH